MQSCSSAKTTYVQDADRFAVEDEAVGIVVDHYQAVSPCKVDQFRVKFQAGISTRGHVGIVRPHQLRLAKIHLFQSVEVGLLPIVLQQVVVNDVTP